MIHAQMAKTNPDKHCPHVSYTSQLDQNGVYKCDWSNTNEIYYNFTEGEWNMFFKVAIMNDIFDPNLERVVPRAEESECTPIKPEYILPKAQDKFDSLDMSCYGFLQVNDATPDMIGMYWGFLFGLTFLFRILGGFALRNQAMRYK